MPQKDMTWHDCFVLYAFVFPNLSFNFGRPKKVNKDCIGFCLNISSTNPPNQLPETCVAMAFTAPISVQQVLQAAFGESEKLQAKNVGIFS